MGFYVLQYDTVEFRQGSIFVDFIRYKKRVIPHLGTDYAAPKGTPIRAVADGVVEKASRTKNNGNYVKN